MDYSSYIPQRWLAGSALDSVWLAAYEVLAASEEDVQRATSSIEVLDGHVRLGFGSLEHFDMSSVHWVVTPGRGPKMYGEPELIATPKLPFLLIMLPMPGGREDPNSEEARRQVNVIVGLLGGLVGRNIVGRFLFEVAIDVPETTPALFGRVPNPFRHGKPDLGDERLSELEQASSAAINLPQDKQDRLRLSLRWFAESLQRNDVDAFLRGWIAVETLAMPTSGNIRPVVESLASAYEMAYDDAKATFNIGLLADTRAKVVHEGRSELVFPALDDYLKAVYLDLLRHALNLPARKQAGSILDRDGVSMWNRLKELREGQD